MRASAWDYDETVLERIVAEMQSAGASYAEARLHLLETTAITIMNGAVVNIGRERRWGAAYRAIADGGLGFASETLHIEGKPTVDAGKRAVAAARTSARLVRSKVSLGPARLGRATYQVVPRRPFEDVSLDEKIALLKGIAGEFLVERGSFRVQSIVLVYREMVEEKLLVTSDGALVRSRIPRVSIFYNVAAKSDRGRANRWFMIGGSGGLEVVEAEKLRSHLSSDVESLYVNLVKAEASPKGVMDVVVSPEIAGIMAHEASGHPSEADRILGREAAQAGMSFRTTYKGRLIGSRYVTVIDDPTIPGSYGFYLYDDEGVAARPRILYKNGELNEMLHNRETAAIYGVESNGAARAMDYRSEPIIRMSNTYIAPGDHKFDELIEDVRMGIYISKYMEWNIDDIRWGQRYGALEAYLILNGRIEKPVRGAVLEGTTRELFSSVDAVSRDLKFYSGTCGKGEPPQGVPVWMGGPYMRLRGVRVR
ncbi:MAG: TldD/PmbA family protein [Desulfurococcales archaeon]|nr:TldD/PmbA family protein [Desulfurococcales archaeon]